jgi:SAM-dependent methyltransferase
VNTTQKPNDPYHKDAYFAVRFTDNPARGKLWEVLCRYLQRDIPPDGAVLELGGGYCDFINNIRAREKHAMDLFAGIREAAAPGVETHVQSCTSMPNFRANSFDTVFASNLFEHLTREQLADTLAEVLRVLRPGGRLIVIQPNFKYAYRYYFDDFTHIQIFTDVGLADLFRSHGFEIERVVSRFLPFSLKVRAPKWPWLLSVYLALPWRPFAGQMYIRAAKPK